MNYFYIFNGASVGPISFEQIINIITEETLIWKDDGSMIDWKPAKEIQEFAEIFSTAIEKSFYYAENGQTLGPLTVSELKNKINTNTLLWCADGSMKEWQHAGSIDEFKYLNHVGSISSPIIPNNLEIQKSELNFDFLINEITNRRPTLGLFVKGRLLKGEININDVLYFSDKRQNYLELVVTDIYIHEKVDMEDFNSFNSKTREDFLQRIYQKHPSMKNMGAISLIAKCVQGDVILITDSRTAIKWGFNANRELCEDCYINLQQKMM